MRIQEIEGYTFDVKLAWLEPDMIQFKLLRTVGTEQRNQDFYFTPEELARLAEYINDTLCH
jgi:hypothetical protein